MPIFCVKSVKIYTGQKNLHGYTRGIRDKLEVWSDTSLFVTEKSPANVLPQTRIAGGLCQVDPDWGTSENSLFSSCLVGDNCIIHVQQCNPRKILVFWTNLQNPQRKLFFSHNFKKHCFGSTTTLVGPKDQETNISRRFGSFHFSQSMMPPASLSPYKGNLLHPA